MQRTCTFALLTAIVAVGCGERGAPRPAVDDGPRKDPVDARGVVLKDAPDKGEPRVDPPLPGGGDAAIPALPPMTDREAHDFYVQKAIDHVARRQYADALAALKEAQSKEDSGLVQREMDKVAALLAQQEAGERAARDVKSVLDEGNPAEAAKLAQEALNQFGGGDAGEPLTRLHLQAEAEVTAGAGNPAARRAVLKVSAEAALADGNLRAAAVAMEQAQAIVADEEMGRQLDALRERLAAYDDNRARAAEARRDAARLEEALTRLRAAREKWDTLQIRQEIDEASLVLERRRDRLSVVDFEVRGDVGLPAAGQAVAEELLSHLKGKYELVERGQLAKLADELKLESTDLMDGGAGRRELGRLARVRYMVVGSITPLSGLTVQARLVEVATGLIVQTARVSAPTPEALMPKLKDLAVMLQMDDAAKAAYEAKLSATVEVLKPVAATELVDIPPPPPPPPDVARLVAPDAPPPPPPPPPIITFTAAAPPLGGVVIADFAPARLPPLLVVDAPPPPAFGLMIARDVPRRNRMLRLSLELGDNMFRRGNFREAQRQFGLALTLGGPRREISLRLDACRNVAPPPPPPVVIVPPRPVLLVPNPFAVIAPPPPPVVLVAPPRSRMAVFGFVPSRVGLVPDRAGEIYADQLASYFGGQYEVVDRGEASWFMGRLGITMRDILNDPVARRALAESLNTRYFVFTTLQATASMDVTTHMIDAQADVRTATASIHVKDEGELKLRLGEIAGQLGAKPAERAAMAKTGAASEKALNEARALVAKEPAKAAAVAREALKAAPDSVALRTLQAEADRRVKLAAFEEKRKEEQKTRAFAVEAAKKRQQEWAIEAAQARAKAQAEAKERTAAQQAEAQARRDRAAAALQAQAKAASAKGDSAAAVRLLQSASTLRPSEAASQELVRAKLLAEADAKKAARDAEEKRLAAAQKQRESAAARVQKEREARLAAEAEKKKALDANDARVHDGYVKQGQAALKAGKPAEAMAAAQSAQRLKASPEAARLLRDAQDALGQASAKTAAEKKRLEQEQADRAAREAVTVKKRSDYSASLTGGAADVKAGDFAAAIAKYEAAAKLFPGDPVASSGLKAARELKARKEAADKAAATAAERGKARLAELSSQAKAAEGKRDYRAAVQLWAEATKLAPGDVVLLTALHKAENERDAEVARVRRDQEERTRKAEAAKLVASGKAILAKNPKGAADAFRGALAHEPTNAEARSLLAKAEAASAPAADPMAKRRQEDYKLALGAGDAAVKANNLKGAVNSYREAVRLMPADATAKGKLASAEKLYQDILEREGRAKVDAAYSKESADGAALLKGRKFAEASAAFDRALAARPGDKQAIEGKRQALEGLKSPPADPRKAAYDKAMAAGQAAMAKLDYEAAATAFEAAMAADPSDRLALSRRDVARAKLADQQFQAAIKKAEGLLAANQFAEASRAFDAALKIKPTDKAALDGKARALAGLTPKPDPKKTAYDKAMAAGAALLARNDFAGAKSQYEEALKLFSGDKAALDGRARAVAGLTPRPDPKKAAYDRATATAAALMAKKDFAGAKAQYEEALKLFPTDKAALDGRAQAVAGLTPPADPKKALYAQAVARAQAAAAKADWAAAAAAYGDALKQFPMDAAAIKGRADADAAHRETVYQAWLKQGQTLLAAKKLSEAAAAFDNALKAKPGDKAAIEGKRQATAVPTPPMPKPVTPPMPKPVPATGIAEFNKLFTAAQDSEKGARWAEAGARYAAALAAIDKDAKAVAQQAAAYAGIGRSDHAQKKFAGAIKAYQEALKRNPKDAATAAALARAQKGM